MSCQIARDPFARETIIRERNYDAGNCTWCGCMPHTTPKGRTYLFRYFVETDGGRKNAIPGTFCSVSCMRSYHE